MKHIKFFGLVLILFLLASCQSNPANQINEQIKLIQTANNVLINQINSLTAHDSELQAAFESDLNAEAMTVENSEMNRLLTTRKEEASTIGSHIDSFVKRLEDMDKIDVSNLDKGLAQFEQLKANLSSMKGFYQSLSAKLTELFDSESQLLNVTISEEPSIQDLQDSLQLVNTKNGEFQSLLGQLKESDKQFIAHIEQWQKALDSEDDETVTEPSETINVSEEPVVEEPTLPETNKVLYTVDDNFYIRSIEAQDNKLVLLTFDDAVQPEPDSYTLQIAKTLKEKGVSAIFFFNGMHLESDFGKDVLKQVHDMGFTIGNHTYYHPYLDKLGYEETKEEIVKTNDIIESVTGERPKIFRPSFGIMGDHSEQVLKEEGMIWMNWTYGYDWEEQYMNGDSLADIMVNTELLGDGANLLMHDRKWTAEAIGKIVDGLVDKGFQIINPKEIQITGGQDDL